MKFIVKTVARGAIAVGAALGAAGGFAQSGPLTGEYKAWDPVKALQDAQQRIAEGKDPIPGPRTCFWARGPAAADPYINIAYPDSATYYWAAVFTMPPGSSKFWDANASRTSSTDSP